MFEYFTISKPKKARATVKHMFWCSLATVLFGMMSACNSVAQSPMGTSSPDSGELPQSFLDEETEFATKIDMDIRPQRPVNLSALDDEKFKHLLEHEEIGSLKSEFNKLGDGECGKHADEFYNQWYYLSSKYKDEVKKSGSLRQHLLTQEQQSLDEKFSNYDENCLSSRLDRIPKEIQRVVGILEVRGNNGKPFCTTTLIGPRTVITSRHCFVEPTRGQQVVGCRALSRPGLSIRFLYDLYKEYKVEGLLDSDCARLAESYSIQNDFIKLELTQDVQNAIPASLVIDKASFKPGTLFWTIGYSDYVAQANPNATSLPKKAIRYAPRLTCGVLISTKHCIFHSCQTAPGMSGAGLLQQKKGGGIELIGVHVGTSELYKECGHKPLKINNVNLATRL